MSEHTLRYCVIGMDCADDARDIEKTARGVDTVRDVRVSVASQVMTLHLVDPATGASDVEEAVAGLGYRLHPITDDPKDTEAGNTQTHLTPAYRRALWIVVLLNLGYGAVEMVGGFLSDSQALKADALDFLGDGLITFLGIVAVRWGLAWRARSALIQGIFLGAMGVGVLVNTLARVQGGYEPEADIMGLLGIIALAVNVAAVIVLLPHRAGDANVRTVWLFSRNDAIGNLAVVIAAGLVAWSGTSWPDLVVAFAIAGLFLHSSWSIIADARRDLDEASSAST
ncbi:MAG TPA: cation transporter [Thermomicrobiales bacterium]|nr:cation transporter [Thermomicrobiales bacterium]